MGSRTCNDCSKIPVVTECSECGARYCQQCTETMEGSCQYCAPALVAVVTEKTKKKIRREISLLEKIYGPSIQRFFNRRFLYGK